MRKRDQRPYNLLYYQTHRQAELGRVQKRQRDAVEFLRQLRSVLCLDCGRAFPPYVMDFEHRDPSEKSTEVPRLLGRVTTDRLLQEISKCDVVCANCHRLRTYSSRLSSRAGVL